MPAAPSRLTHRRRLQGVWREKIASSHIQCIREQLIQTLFIIYHVVMCATP